MSMVSTYHPDSWRFRTETISTCKLPHINYYNEQTMAYKLYNRIVKRFHTKIIKKTENNCDFKYHSSDVFYFIFKDKD